MFINYTISSNTVDQERNKDMFLNHHPEAVEQRVTKSEEAPVQASIPAATDEPVTNPLLFPTMPDLNEVTSRR